MTGRFKASGLTRPGVMLALVLIGHLALMASPLHAMAMYPDGEELAALASEGGSASTMPSASCMGGASTCSTEWSAPISRGSIGLSITSLSIGTTSFVPDQTLSRNTFPRTLGPPLTLDTQAILQVFRL